MSSSYPVDPPSYQPTGSERLLVPNPGDGEPPRSETDPNDVPDDFKYGTSVSSCAIDIRHAFIRRVYTILFAQLGITALGCVLLAANPGTKEWVFSNMWAFFVAMIGAIGLMIGAFVKRRSFPWNLMFLFGFTVCESYMVGAITLLYDTNIVLEALVITVVVFAGLTLWAFQTKYDVSSWQGYLGAALWGLIGFSFIYMFFPTSRGVEIVYSAIAAAVFCGYIMFDTVMIMRRYHPEDEVPAAISLYLDLINLFLNILRLLGALQNDNN